jgi:tRNA U34 2-thiouridine synthase MnmA/TrmU
MAKAIALLSGGLDSTLAVLIAKRQGIEVTAVTFLTHFGCDISDTSSCSRNPFPAAEKFGFTVKLSHLAEKFVEIVKSPKYGHGRNMNPCVDCRILMLREAKELMRMLGADFVITGEVLGQRPMSQRRESFPLIDREAGVEGYVLRPLSAKLLTPTIPEMKGLVDRERLCAISGRSRKPQMALAEEFGLEDYPNPAGGCLLTDPIFAHRLRELLEYDSDPTLRALNLLRYGRHFRVSPSVKAVVGRDEAENNAIESLAENGEHLIRAEDCGSPVTLITGNLSGTDIISASKLTARYCDFKRLPSVTVSITRKRKDSYKMEVPPADDSLVEALRIHKPEKRRKKAVSE